MDSVKNMMAEEMDFTTAPCKWTEKDAEIIADYLAFNKLGLKNSPTLTMKDD